MKNLLLIIIFFTIAFDSHAQSNWVYVTSNSKSDDFFVDRSSFQTQGDSITFWQRMNYEQRNKFGDLSAKIQYTINCRTREQIMRFSMYYDDIDNNGRLTTSGKPSNPSWEPIAPDTVSWSLYKFVCK
jgi:hypothetical protein